MRQVEIQWELRCDSCNKLIEQKSKLTVNGSDEGGSTSGMIDKHFKLVVEDGYDEKEIFLCDECHDKLPKVLQEECLSLEESDNYYY